MCSEDEGMDSSRLVAGDSGGCMGLEAGVAGGGEAHILRSSSMAAGSGAGQGLK